VREAIQATVGRIVVAADGSLTLEAKPEGLLGLDGTTVPLWCRGGMDHQWSKTESARPFPSGIRWPLEGRDQGGRRARLRGQGLVTRQGKPTPRMEPGVGLPTITTLSESCS
jgi:hypothetical protein